MSFQDRCYRMSPLRHGFAVTIRSPMIREIAHEALSALDDAFAVLYPRRSGRPPASSGTLASCHVAARLSTASAPSGEEDDDGLARPPSRNARCNGGRNAERDCHGEKRSNPPHRSTTDPEARLYRKGDSQPARRCDLGHVLMENRHGLVVEAGASLATGTTERETALELPGRRQAAHRMTTKRMTLGADKAYDVVQFIHDLRRRPITPHTAIDGHVTETGTQRETTIDRRTTRHVGHGIS